MQSVAFRAHPSGRLVVEVKPVAMLDPILYFACNEYKRKKRRRDWCHTCGGVGREGKESLGVPS